MRHHRIALVEAMDLTGVRNWEPKQDDYSNRVVSLTPGSMGFFESMHQFIYSFIIKNLFYYRNWCH